MSDSSIPGGSVEEHRSKSLLPLIVVIVVGLAISIAASASFYQLERNARQIAFENFADDRIHALETKIQSTVALLESIRGLFAASEVVDRSEFRRFVMALGIDSAVQALSWIPQVTLSERSAMEALAIQDGVSAFRFTERREQGVMFPAARRPLFYPVYYIEPSTGNESALGFDLASNAARLAALNQAKDSGDAIATSRITLVQEVGDQFGFLMFLPIYRNGSPADTIENRRDNLAGFTTGVFRVGNLVDIAARDNDSARFAVALEIFDKSAPIGSQRLYPKSDGSDDDAKLISGLHSSKSIDMAGREWNIVATPAAGSAFAQPIWKPWVILLIGLSFTGLLARHLKLNQNRTADINALVTERTARLRNVAEALKRSNAELEQFAVVASHDLQEPLRKVQAFSDRLRGKYDAVLDEQGLDYLARMHDAAGRMQTLVNDLLTYSRVSTKNEAFTHLALDEAVQEVVADLEVRIEETGARIEIRNLPTIDAAPLQMRQLFQNLISNSLKYRREGVPPVVKITGEAAKNGPVDFGGTPTKSYRIVVEDNGLGFEEQYAERIFGIFERLNGRSKSQGTGIGLAICRKIVEHHGGTIVAHGRPGVGSTFAVTLPLRHQSRA